MMRFFDRPKNENTRNERAVVELIGLWRGEMERGNTKTFRRERTRFVLYEILRSAVVDVYKSGKYSRRDNVGGGRRRIALTIVAPSDFPRTGGTRGS